MDDGLMPTEVTDPEILKRLNGDKGTTSAEPKKTPSPAPKSPRTDPQPSTTRSFFSQLGSDAMDSAKHFGTATARGFLSSATALGQDITSGLPMGVLDPALGDVALQETRRQAAEKVKGWTPGKDPKFPYSENIGEFVGESLVPSAAAAMIPGFGLGRLVEKGVAKGGKWLIGTEAERVAKATKGMPFGVRGKGGQMGPNPARVAAGEAAKAEQKAAEQKIGERASQAGKVILPAEQGAVAGALQPTDNREKAAGVGATAALGTEMARRVLGPKLGAAANVVAASAATLGLQKVLGHPIDLAQIGFHEGIIWYALYKMHLGEGVGALGSKIAQPAIVGGTTAYATGEKRKEEGQ